MVTSSIVERVGRFMRSIPSRVWTSPPIHTSRAHTMDRERWRRMQHYRHLLDLHDKWNAEFLNANNVYDYSPLWRNFRYVERMASRASKVSGCSGVMPISFLVDKRGTEKIAATALNILRVSPHNRAAAMAHGTMSLEVGYPENDRMCNYFGVPEIEYDDLGTAFYLAAWRARPMHSDEYGDLYRLRFPEQILSYVAVRCSSTGKLAILRVPEYHLRAHSAVAWTFGRSVDNYKPLLQT